MIRATAATERRTTDRLREHYLAECALANQLRQASREERQGLYSKVYDELFRRVPDHPQLTRKASASEKLEAIAVRMHLLNRFLRRESVFMEIGPGDCSLALAVAKHARHVYAVDVSAEITKQSNLPSNFELMLCDGASLPVPHGSVDVAFSYQLIEHLHPADAVDHLANVFQALRPGGVYVCVTPNRLNGPHDISRFFEDRPTGFHLKEYTASDLSDAMKAAGFASTTLLCGAGGGRYVQMPVAPVRAIERLISPMPYALRLRVAGAAGLRHLLGVAIVARKAGAGT